MQWPHGDSLKVFPATHYLPPTALCNCRGKSHDPLNLACSLLQKEKSTLSALSSLPEMAPGYLELGCRSFYIQLSHYLEAHPNGASQRISCCSCADYAASPTVMNSFVACDWSLKFLSDLFFPNWTFLYFFLPHLLAFELHNHNH